MPTASQQAAHCFKVIQAANAAMLQHHDSDAILVETGSMASCAAEKACACQHRATEPDDPNDGAIGCELNLCRWAWMVRLQMKSSTPCHHRWAGLRPHADRSWMMKVSMLHLPNSAGDKDRLQ
jgi:hypothetical protein